MNEQTAVTAAQHTLMNGEAEIETAIDQIIGVAHRQLQLFDPDLSKGGYNTAARCEAIRTFLAGNRAARFVIVLHETDFLTRHCPRLMQLLKTYSHAITILQTQEHGRIASDPLLIADGSHYLHRFHADSPRALLALHDPAGARPLEERFAQLQEASSPAVFADTLGL